MALMDQMVLMAMVLMVEMALMVLMDPTVPMMVEMDLMDPMVQRDLVMVLMDLKDLAMALKSPVMDLMVLRKVPIDDTFPYILYHSLIY